MSYRYLGNKTKLAEWIVDSIAHVVPPGATIADPMCGTAAVSVTLAKAGYNVFASDALTFPVIHARARLLPKAPPSFLALGGYEGALEWMRSVEPVEGYFFREFGAEGRPENGRPPRLYFSARNAAHIDALRNGIKRLWDDGQIDHIEQSILLHHLMLAANRVANINGTYGYFRAKLSGSALAPLTFEPLHFLNTPGQHSVCQGNVEDLAATLVADAVYLDPPYTKRQYAGNYHILETLARGDEPPAIGDGGLRPWRDQASDFCYRRTAGRAFEDILSRLTVPHVFISYSEDGQVREQVLMSILAKYGTVRVHEQEHQRYRSNGRGKGGYVLERLYHVEMGGA